MISFYFWQKIELNMLELPDQKNTKVQSIFQFSNHLLVMNIKCIL